MMVSRRDRNFGGLFPGAIGARRVWFLVFNEGGNNNTKLHGFVREESFLVRWCQGGRLAAAGKLRWPFM